MALSTLGMTHLSEPGKKKKKGRENSDEETKIITANKSQRKERGKENASGRLCSRVSTVESTRRKGHRAGEPPAGEGERRIGGE